MTLRCEVGCARVPVFCPDFPVGCCGWLARVRWRVLAIRSGCGFFKELGFAPLQQYRSPTVFAKEIGGSGAVATQAISRAGPPFSQRGLTLCALSQLTAIRRFRCSVRCRSLFRRICPQIFGFLFFFFFFFLYFCLHVCAPLLNFSPGSKFVWLPSDMQRFYPWLQQGEAQNPFTRTPPP